MPTVRNFTVLPVLPEPIKELETIARNMFWAWNPQFIEIFRRIDSKLWTSCGHNPVKLLGSVSQERFEELSADKAFVRELSQAAENLKVYLETPTWFEKVCPDSKNLTIAYFSAEFGIHECLPVYAGGLGGLAGDHLKSASDLGVPIVGIGLLYQKGYFRQYLNADGWQQETYAENDFYGMPMEPVCDKNGQPLTISVEYPGRAVHAQIWSVSVGRVKLYLLDTNIKTNSSADRMTTASLYGGDIELRIRQEIMLGIGGLRALNALGIKPDVCHMNEGHAAFMALERIRQLQCDKNLTFDEAAEATRAGNVFTVHTPVKAGIDEFRVELMDKYFEGYYPGLGISREQFLSFGRILPDDDSEPFKMPILALKLSGFANGVSKLHGEVSRGMWAALWPGVPLSEVPIKSITNGVHTRTWLSEEMGSLYERYLGPNWNHGNNDTAIWDNIEQVPDEEFWRLHQRCKGHLIAFARNRLKEQMQRRGTYHTELNWAEEVLDIEALTIGFARRFASYKRGSLLLKDAKRLVKLLSNTERPVQIIFAGKSHPRDTQGKEIIRQIVRFADQYNVRRRIIFLEDYDIDIARVMVRGVDVWLNNPRRPLEASGTSGMKAAVNGALNLSTLDGWWCEGFRPEGGWAIGSGERYDDPAYQDEVESQAIYNLLENEVVPLFYTRSADNIPRAWIHRVKNSIKWIAPRFNTHRMVGEYTRRFYNPAATKWRSFTANGLSVAKQLSAWKSQMKNSWSELAVVDVKVSTNGYDEDLEDCVHPQLKIGSEFNVRALLQLGSVNADDVSVQLYHGPVDAWSRIIDGCPIGMELEKPAEQDGHYWFKGSISCKKTGNHGMAVRILPRNADMIHPYEAGLILWETPAAKSACASS